jgi:hypothetical protein
LQSSSLQEQTDQRIGLAGRVEQEQERIESVRKKDELFRKKEEEGRKTRSDANSTPGWHWQTSAEK